MYGNNSENALIIECYNSGKIEGTKKWVGGIVGYNGTNTSVQDCYNIGTIIGNTEVGGISGRNQGSIIDIYNVGIIEADGEVGGIVGGNVGKIENAYNVGKIPDMDSSGGIVGINFKSDQNLIGNINNAYSLDKVYGINETYIKNSLVKNDDEMKEIADSLGSSFENDINNINKGYPILKWQES